MSEDIGYASILTPNYLLAQDISEGDGIWYPNIAKSMGVSVATIRASLYLRADKLFETNWRFAIQAGIKKLAYHWFVPTLDAVAQANYFVAHSYSGEYPRMVDLEDYPKGGIYAYVGIADKIKLFLDRVEALTGERCLIYVNKNYSDSYFRRPYATGTSPRDSWLSTYPVVIASWNNNYPAIPWPWHPMLWQGWQYSGYIHGPTYGIQSTQTSLYIWKP